MVTAPAHYECIGCLCGFNAFSFTVRYDLASVTGSLLVNPVAGLLFCLQQINVKVVVMYCTVPIFS